MKAIAITSKGIEDICSKEIEELIKAKTETKESCVIFEPKKVEDLCLLCYKAQSVDKILFLFNSFSFNEKSFFNDLKKIIDKIDFSKWLDKDMKFMVSCKKDNDHLSTEEVCSKTGELIIDKIKEKEKYNQKVDLNNPDLIIFVYIVGNNCYLGIDFSGFDLHKRSHKIFVHSSSLRGTIAYALVRIADFKEKETLLDAFTGSGTIPIEAALYTSNFPVNYFNKDKFSFLRFKDKINPKKIFSEADKKIKTTKSKIYGYDSVLGYVTNSKKNAKIAGINKQINFSRIDIEWLDTKFDKESIDKIVANPPNTRSINQKEIEKVYNEFFYQAEFVLKKTGKIVLISTEKSLEFLKKYAEKYKFKLKEERVVYSGKAPLKVAVFSK
jgi:putative N6-adenine-specific DNA methylase